MGLKDHDWLGERYYRRQARANLVQCLMEYGLAKKVCIPSQETPVNGANEKLRVVLPQCLYITFGVHINSSIRQMFFMP